MGLTLDLACPQAFMADRLCDPLPFEGGVGQGGDAGPDLPEALRPLPTAILAHPMPGGVLVRPRRLPEKLLGVPRNAIVRTPLAQHQMQMGLLLPLRIAGSMHRPAMWIALEKHGPDVRSKFQPCFRR